MKFTLFEYIIQIQYHSVQNQRPSYCLKHLRPSLCLQTQNEIHTTTARDQLIIHQNQKKRETRLTSHKKEQEIYRKQQQICFPLVKPLKFVKCVKYFECYFENHNEHKSTLTEVQKITTFTKQCKDARGSTIIVSFCCQILCEWLSSKSRTIPSCYMFSSRYLYIPLNDFIFQTDLLKSIIAAQQLMFST